MKQRLVVPVLGVALSILAFKGQAQGPTRRQVEVTVTDPRGRFVTGLEQETFVVMENGVPRALTDFSNLDSPITIAIVGEGPLPDLGALGADDRLVLSTSVSDALLQLAASKTLRKAIVNLTAIAPPVLPERIQYLQTTRADVIHAVTGLHNRYLLEFESTAPTANFAVTLKQPAGLPHLEVTWK